MARTYDTEQQRVINQIKCIAFREKKDSGATFTDRNDCKETWKITRQFIGITQKWVKAASADLFQFCQ